MKARVIGEVTMKLLQQCTGIFWIHAQKDVKKWTKELIPLMKNRKIKYAGVSNHNLEEIKIVDNF